MNSQSYRISSFRPAAAGIAACIAAVFLLAPRAGAGPAGVPAAPGGSQTYREAVRPFLDQHCVECHDETTQKGGVRLIQTDSTRLVALSIQGSGLVPPIEGVTEGHHNLSHHGKDPKKLEQLKAVELAEFAALGEFLGKLKGNREEGQSLLDRTMVFYGSNLGNASSHDNKNMPALLAGGGVPPRAAPGVRPAEERAAGQPIRLDAPATRRRDRHVRLRPRHPRGAGPAARLNPKHARERGGPGLVRL